MPLFSLVSTNKFRLLHPLKQVIISAIESSMSRTISRTSIILSIVSSLLGGSEKRILLLLLRLLESKSGNWGQSGSWGKLGIGNKSGNPNLLLNSGYSSIAIQEGLKSIEIKTILVNKTILLKSKLNLTTRQK